MTHLVIRMPYRHRRSFLGRLTVQPKRGTYTGRLGFDPDTLFHTDKQGRRVVTDDAGLSWRYARRHDMPHNARYQRSAVAVASTTAADAHHVEVQEADAHHDPYAPGTARPISLADAEAIVATSHTDAWKETV